MVDYENVSAEIECIARAICTADGCNPDQVTVGLGKSMPEGYKYPLWKARIKQAKAVLTVSAS